MEIEESVKFVRLNTGEDLITQLLEVVQDESHYFTLINPMKVLYTGSTSGYMTVGLMQWVFNRICKEQSFDISSDDILMIGKPTDSIVEYYWECVDHFNKPDTTTKEEKPSPVSDEEGYEMLQEILDSIKKDKRSLH